METVDAKSAYQIVAEGLAELGVQADTPISRTILLRQRFYVGQAFQAGGFRAVLPADSETIQFHDQSGRLVKTIQLPNREPMKRLTAA